MKFVYIDESGTGNEPIACMVGIITDAYRMRQTKEDWKILLNELSEIINQNIDEIHTRDFYSGNGKWRDIDGTERSNIINLIFEWLSDIKHDIIFTAVNKQNFNNEIISNEKLKKIGAIWKFMALHIVLSLQKYYQGKIKNRNERKINPKGSFLLIFDREDKEQEKFTDFLLALPDWTDTYYDKKLNQEKLSQIIDVPHFVDSTRVPLVQVADFVSFFLRKHIELELRLTKEKYDGEKDQIKNWINSIRKNFIPMSNIYPKKGRCNCAELFYKCAGNILNLDFIK